MTWVCLESTHSAGSVAGYLVGVKVGVCLGCSVINSRERGIRILIILHLRDRKPKDWKMCGFDSGRDSESQASGQGLGEAVSGLFA